jgi:hypothetical protein
MLVGELESSHETKRLIHTATHRKVVHGDLTKVLLGIDEEQASAYQSLRAQTVVVIPQRDASVLASLDQNIVVVGDLLGQV